MSKFEMKDSPSNEVNANQLDFSTLVLSFATSALIHLGHAPNPTGEKTPKNLPVAKQNIEILEILERKTKGNLTAEEQALITNVLAEVRLHFIDASKK